jgi:hypothetical protein
MSESVVGVESTASALQTPVGGPSSDRVGIDPNAVYSLGSICICYPPHPAFDRLAELFTVAFSRNGADPNIGRRLAELYRDAGLDDVAIEARSGVYPLGHSRRTIRPDLVRTLRSQILALGAADEQELDELDAAARTHLADPDVVVMPSLYFLAAGRKPAAA